MMIPLDGQPLAVHLKGQHGDDLRPVMDRTGIHIDHRAVVPFALAAPPLPIAEGIDDQRLLQRLHHQPCHVRHADAIDGMRLHLRRQEQPVLLLRFYIQLKLAVRQIGDKGENHMHAHEQADLHFAQRRILPAQRS